MTRTLDTAHGDRERTAAYNRDFWPGMVAYGVVLAGVLAWGGLDGTSPWRFLWVALPVLPALWVLRAVVRHLGRIDDYQRQLVFRGLSVGFGAAMIVSLTAGFAMIAGFTWIGLPWVIYGAGMIGWAVGQGIASRR
jgi:hypothetical protein